MKVGKMYSGSQLLPIPKRATVAHVAVSTRRPWWPFLRTMVTECRPLTTELPPTLAKWRAYRTLPLIAVWDPLRDWFSSKGLHIFHEVKGFEMVKPPLNELRAHDGTYSTHYGPPNLAYTHRVYEHIYFSVPSDLTNFSESNSLHRSKFGRS